MLQLVRGFAIRTFAEAMLSDVDANIVQPDIKSLQISLTGFLDKDAARFCKELWSLCLSAQSNPQGVPKELLEAKKMELLQEKVRTASSEDTTID